MRLVLTEWKVNDHARTGGSRAQIEVSVGSVDCTAVVGNPAVRTVLVVHRRRSVDSPPVARGTVGCSRRMGAMAAAKCIWWACASEHACLSDAGWLLLGGLHGHVIGRVVGEWLVHAASTVEHVVDAGHTGRLACPCWDVTTTTTSFVAAELPGAELLTS